MSSIVRARVLRECLPTHLIELSYFLNITLQGYRLGIGTTEDRYYPVFLHFFLFIISNKMQNAIH